MTHTHIEIQESLLRNSAEEPNAAETFIAEVLNPPPMGQIWHLVPCHLVHGPPPQAVGSPVGHGSASQIGHAGLNPSLQGLRGGSVGLRGGGKVPQGMTQPTDQPRPVYLALKAKTMSTTGLYN